MTDLPDFLLRGFGMFPRSSFRKMSQVSQVGHPSSPLLTSERQAMRTTLIRPSDGFSSEIDTVNGSETVERRCDHCRRIEATSRWDWPGRPDGIWLNQLCEEAWYESQRDFDRFCRR